MQRPQGRKIVADKRLSLKQQFGGRSILSILLMPMMLHSAVLLAVSAIFR